MNLYAKSIKGEKVLDDISYTFESGKIYGIYGKNGSGKTMLLRAIAGFINTDKGYIKYNHKALHKDMDVLPDLGAVIENIRNASKTSSLSSTDGTSKNFAFG